jgi:protein-disulfide isomerase
MNFHKRMLVAIATFTLLTGITALAGDTSSLRPPKGAKVAIVVFEDLQCPDCGRTEPLLEETAKKYNIPIVRHDFPLPQHSWSFDAHVLGRYFDTKSPEVGEEWRKFCLNNQSSITKQNLQGIAQKFAEQHGMEIPVFVDPTGELTNKVKADFALGQRVGVEHTPTIYIVSNTQRGTPFVEVVDRTQMFQLVDQMFKQAEEIPAAKPTKTASKKTASKKKTTANKTQ